MTPAEARNTIEGRRFAALATLSVFQVAQSDGPNRTTASQATKRTVNRAGM